jgi:hypothetical protein
MAFQLTRCAMQTGAQIQELKESAANLGNVSSMFKKKARRAQSENWWHKHKVGASVECAMPLSSVIYNESKHDAC